MKTNKLTEIEWTTLWMSIRYACHRQTIASATLPADIINAYWDRLCDERKQFISNDLKRELDQWGDSAFGSPSIDRPIWLKFMSAMDLSSHYTVKLIDGTECIVFEANDRIYPLKEYIESPHREIYLPKENIKN